MKHKKNIMLTGTGIIATAMVLGVAISCGDVGNKDKEETEDAKKTINIDNFAQFIKEDLTTELTKIRDSSNKSAAEIVEEWKQKDLIIESRKELGVKIKVSLELDDKDDSKIKFSIENFDFSDSNQVIKNDEFDALKDELFLTIDGFKSQDQIDIQNIAPGDINSSMNKLFKDQKEQGVKGAKNRIGNQTITKLGNDIAITFNLGNEDETNHSISYKITKIQKNSRTQEDRNVLKKYDGKIEGFKDQTWRDKKKKVDDFLKETNAKTEIQSKINNLYENLKIKNNATGANGKVFAQTTNSRKTIKVKDGVWITFEAKADNNEKEIEYTIIKISSGTAAGNIEYELWNTNSIIGTNFNGKIDGFKSTTWIDNQRDVETFFGGIDSKTLIKNAIKAKYDKNKTSTEADKAVTDKKVTINDSPKKDITVEFTTVADVTNKKIDYIITKIYKGTGDDKFERLVAPNEFDNLPDEQDLNGTITGFKP